MLKLDAVIAGAASLVPPKSIVSPPVQRAVWEAAVGTRIACRTEPMRLEKGVLHVRVTNAAWANELALLAHDILEQLVKRGVEATALRFSVGPLTTPQPQREAPKPAAPKDVALPKELEGDMVGVRDLELRAALREAAAKSLALAELRAELDRRSKPPSRP